MATVSTSVKQFFFDRAKVQKALDRSTRKNLSLYGRDTRQIARRSIKRKRATKRQLELVRGEDQRKAERARVQILKKQRMVSQPGQPPFSKDPQDKIRKILYFYDPSKKAVITGIVKLSNVVGENVPHNLEYGGATRAVQRFRRRAARQRSQSIQVTVRARPSIRPAGAKAMIKFRARLKDSVK